ncbi:hypothetical protein Tco_0653379, partial [Tanacetum coccineum]
SKYFEWGSCITKEDEVQIGTCLSSCASLGLYLAPLTLLKGPGILHFYLLLMISRYRRTKKLCILSTLHFLKFPENSLEVLKLLENSVEVLKILESKLESMKIRKNKWESLKLQENQPVDEHLMYNDNISTHPLDI